MTSSLCTGPVIQFASGPITPLPPVSITSLPPSGSEPANIASRSSKSSATALDGMYVPATSTKQRPSNA